VCGVHDLGSSDRREIAVALVGKDGQVGVHALDSRCNRRGAPMGGFVHVAVEVLVGED
jgi:hypothetical protein